MQRLAVLRQGDLPVPMQGQPGDGGRLRCGGRHRVQQERVRPQDRIVRSRTSGTSAVAMHRQGLRLATGVRRRSPGEPSAVQRWRGVYDRRPLRGRAVQAGHRHLQLRQQCRLRGTRGRQLLQRHAVLQQGQEAGGVRTQPGDRGRVRQRQRHTVRQECVQHPDRQMRLRTDRGRRLRPVGGRDPCQSLHGRQVPLGNPALRSHTHQPARLRRRQRLHRRRDLRQRQLRRWRRYLHLQHGRGLQGPGRRQPVQRPAFLQQGQEEVRGQPGDRGGLPKRARHGVHQEHLPAVDRRVRDGPSAKYHPLRRRRPVHGRRTVRRRRVQGRHQHLQLLERRPMRGVGRRRPVQRHHVLQQGQDPSHLRGQPGHQGQLRHGGRHRMPQVPVPAQDRQMPVHAGSRFQRLRRQQRLHQERQLPVRKVPARPVHVRVRHQRRLRGQGRRQSVQRHLVLRQDRGAEMPFQPCIGGLLQQGRRRAVPGSQM